MKYTESTQPVTPSEISPMDMKPGTVFRTMNPGEGLVIVTSRGRGFYLKANEEVIFSGNWPKRLPYTGFVTIECEDNR